MGSPPPTPAPNVGAPPPVPQHSEPPPYDVLHDPGWKGIIDPSNKPMVQFLNELSPEHRQMLLQEVMKLKGQAQRPTPIPPQAGPMPVMGAPPIPAGASPLGPP